MIKVKTNPTIKSYRNEGATELEIAGLEETAGIQFPLAYREFLLLCGHQANMLIEIEHSIVDALDRQERIREILEEYNFSLDGDYWAISDLDGGEQFYFFYLEDTPKDNPPIYICNRGYWEDDEVDLDTFKFVEKVAPTFKEFIDYNIDLRKKIGY